MNDGEYLDYLNGRTRVAGRPDGENDVWSDFIAELKKRVAIAEVKHPQFADGIYQGAGCISAEHGEFWNAVTKNEGETRIMDENWDVLVTAFRFWRGDWKRPENSRPEETAAVLEKKDIPPTGDPLFPVHGVWWGTGF
jgi:hypothetical protein